MMDIITHHELISLLRCVVLANLCPRIPEKIFRSTCSGWTETLADRDSKQTTSNRRQLSASVCYSAGFRTRYICREARLPRASGAAGLNGTQVAKPC